MVYWILYLERSRLWSKGGRENEFYRISWSGLLSGWSLLGGRI